MGVEELLRHVVETLEEIDVPYALGGSIASTAYGEPRSTRDIDLVAELSTESVALLEEYFPPPDFHFDIQAARKALEDGRPFNIIQVSSGLKIDIFPPSDLIARSQIKRAVVIVVGQDLKARFSPPEELILKKMAYYQESGSDRHLRDIMGMLQVSGDRIDLDLVDRWAFNQGLSDIWAAIRARELEK